MNRRQFITAAGGAIAVSLAGCGSNNTETETDPRDRRIESDRPTTTVSGPVPEPTTSVPTSATMTSQPRSETSIATAKTTPTPTANQRTSTTEDGLEILITGVDSSDIVVPVGETRIGAVTLTHVLNGLEAYKVTIMAADPDICTFTDITVPGQYSGVIDESISNDGLTARCAVFSAGVSGEQTDVPLGQIKLNGNASGETTLQIDSGGFVDGNDEQFTPIGRDETVTVTES